MNFDWTPVVNEQCNEPIIFDDLKSAEQYCREGEQFVKKSGRFTCSFHMECKYYKKIREISSRFHVFECGSHTTEIKINTYGIPKALRPYTDKYLNVGFGPLKAVANLKEELRTKPELSNLTAALALESSKKKAFQRKLQSRKAGLRHVAAIATVESRKDLEDYLKPFLVSMLCLLRMCCLSFINVLFVCSWPLGNSSRISRTWIECLFYLSSTPSLCLVAKV